MLYLEVSNKRVHVPAGITAQVVHKSAYFTDGLEDSFSLPFEVPVQGNEAVMGHVHELPLRSRITSFEAAQLGHQGLPLYRGTLHVLSSTPHSVRGSFSIDGFVQRVKGVMLPDALRGELIDLTDELVNQGISLSLRPQYADGGKCQFPMYRNTELYGDANPDWYPNASAWRPDQAYALNDLVEFTEYTSYRVRTDVWQCDDPAGTAEGESPVTHPGKWRRTAFGLVNAWDRANNQHHYNTLDGNFYAHVPWFYLKWVLRKALAHVGYAPVGEWMDDERTHELVLANNTTIEAALDTESATLFEAAQNGAAYYDPDDGPWMPLAAQNESPPPLLDPDGLWDAAAGEFIPDQAGTWAFSISTTALSFPAGGTARLYVYRDDLEQAWVPVDWEPISLFDFLAVWIGPVAANGAITMQMAMPFALGDVGQRFRFRLRIQGGTLLQPVLWPTNAQDGITSTRIRGWLQNSAPTVAVPDTVIRCWRHVPEVDVYGLVVAIADAFNLSLEPDEATRTLRMDYKEQELAQQVARTTEHSARVVNDTEIDFQRRITGLVLRWDAETHDEPAEAFLNAAQCMTENDLPIPVATGQRCVVRATRGLWKTIFNAETGTLAWKHVGYHVPEQLVGERDGAQEMQPALKPVHMVQEELEGKEYLIPELPGLGTSAWFHTNGDRGIIWITEFKKQSSSDGTVTNVPGARSWGYGWDADDRSRLTLLWDQPDAELPGLYQTCWQRWLAMLTTAEPVTMDLLVDPAFLKGRDWRHTLLLHGQRYLVQELPVTYGDHGGQLMSEGAYLLRLRPTGTDPLATVPEPEACENPAEVRWSPAIGFVTIVGAEVADTHFAVEVDGAEPVLTPKEETLYLDPAAGNVRAYACDAAGTQACRIIQVIIAGGGGIDLDLSDAGDMLATLQADGVNTLVMPPAHTLTGVWITESALDEATVDALLNSLDDTMADGIVDLSGGTTAAPSAASLAKRTALLANGWTITTN